MCLCPGSVLARSSSIPSNARSPSRGGLGDHFRVQPGPGGETAGGGDGAGPLAQSAMGAPPAPAGAWLGPAVMDRIRATAAITAVTTTAVAAAPRRVRIQESRGTADY